MTAASNSPAPAWDWKRGFNAWIYVAMSVAALGAYSLANPYDKQPITILLCWLVYGVSSIPMVLYLYGRFAQPVPFMAFHGFFYALGFGFAGLLPTSASTSGESPIMTISEAAVQRGLWLSLVGVSVMMAGYYATWRLVPKNLGSLAFARLNRTDLERATWIMTLGVFAIRYLQQRVGIGFLGEASITCFNFVFILFTYLFISKQLSTISKLFYVCVVLPYTVVIFQGIGAGKLAATVLSLLLIGMVYMYARRKIPWSMVAAVVLLVLILQPIKQEFRKIAWSAAGSEVSTLEGLQMMGELVVDHYVHGDHRSDADGWKFFERRLGRINHSVVNAAIIDYTPTRQPYRYGATLMPLVTKWIPRAIWADKPREDLGNRWAHEYGFLGPGDMVTSFNLPWLPEFYMNFGTLGIVCGMLLLGVLFRVFHRLFWEAPRGPLEYAFGLTLANSMMLAESNFSMMFGAFFVGIAILLIFIGGTLLVVEAGRRMAVLPGLKGDFEILSPKS